MIETNIHLLRDGMKLSLDVRQVQLQTDHVSPELVEKVCRSLQWRKLAAVPAYGEHDLFVASLRPLRIRSLTNPSVKLLDVGKQRLYVSNPQEAGLLARLFERHLLIRIRRDTDMWTFGKSQRLWYEAEPFKTKDGVAAYRRFQVSVLPLEKVGLGVVTHVSTSFFTVDSVADFFDSSQKGQARRQARWQRLNKRQRNQRATLLYQLPHSQSSCYFEKFLPHKTCGTAEGPTIGGKTYDSLYDYYQEKQPEAGIQVDDPVALVSFDSFSNPVPVAANRLYLRVMNENVPDALSQVDKLRPHERIRETERFWGQLDGKLFGKPLESSFWKPPSSVIQQIAVPTLRFGQQEELLPAQSTRKVYQTHFNARFPTLKKAGCYYVPPTIERKVTLCYPSECQRDLVKQLATDFRGRLNGWTGKRFSIEENSYTETRQAIKHLNSRGHGLVLFVMPKGDSAAYYLLSAEIERRRIKRVTSETLNSCYQVLQDGNRRKWDSMIDMTTLDVLLQLDCVPWTIAHPLHYQAQLAIDVGAYRRHVALSLLAYGAKVPFWLNGQVVDKPRYDEETIEYELLRDKLIELANRLPQSLLPLKSLLVLRDGRQSGNEGDAIREAQAELCQQGVFASNIKLDLVDLAKQSLKEVRLWRRQGNRVYNALEGTSIQLDPQTLIMVTTGDATLHQGTAQPLVLSATHDGIDLQAVASDLFATAQLNWSNPRIAQRLPMVLRWIDQSLRERYAKETRGLN